MGTATDKLDAFGTDALCEAIAEGSSLTAIAKQVKVSIGSLLSWINADTERSARTREVRSATARLWDEKAEDEIRGAKNALQLAKARELSHHYRWRASKIDPKGYGDKLGVEHSGSIELANALEAARKRVSGDGES